MRKITGYAAVPVEATQIAVRPPLLPSVVPVTNLLQTYYWPVVSDLKPFARGCCKEPPPLRGVAHLSRRSWATLL